MSIIGYLGDLAERDGGQCPTPPTHPASIPNLLTCLERVLHSGTQNDPMRLLRLFIARSYCRIAALLAIAVVLCHHGINIASADSVDAIDAAIAADPVLAKGAAIYADQCLTCHGENGVGTEDYYPDALIGDATVGELEELIADTMPEEDPEACVADDAAAVASFIHHAFYSEAAQLRRRPPRRALQRLTGAQLRQSLVDLYSSFTGFADTRLAETRKANGLQASYYNGRKWDKKDRLIDRIDPQVDFDFGLDGPGEGIDGEAFHAHWNGGLRVPETGTYEFVLRSESSFGFFLGNDDRQLIDNHVQSAGLTEFRRKVRLTGGTHVPLKIDLYQRKRKTGAVPSNISLAWIRPGHVEEVIPAKWLVPSWSPATLQLDTVMPPDDNSYGFERGIRVDATWDEAVTSAALELGEQLATEVWPRRVREIERKRKQKKKDIPTRSEALDDLLTQLVSRAHRGTADDTGAAELVSWARSYSQDETEIIKVATLATIKSPRFLYPTLDQDRTVARRIANRLSLVLHDSLPTNNGLLDAAEKGYLKDPKQIRNCAERLADDSRTRAKLRRWVNHWLEMHSDDDFAKEETLYPGFDAGVVSDLRKSLETFVDDVIWSETSDYRQLIAADWMPTTNRLPDFYGEHWQAKSDASDAAASLPRTQPNSNIHVGVLSHPLLMSKFAHFDASSPIHRGVFLVRHIMGRTLRPPNAAFAPLSPDLHPDLTTRERVQLQTGAESCQICHSKINPLGFALEQFDAVGRFRDHEIVGDGQVKSIDASGHYADRNDQEVQFRGARELAEFVIGSHDAHRAVVQRLFQYFVKQPVAAYGPNKLEELTQHFIASNFNIRELIIEIAVVAASMPTHQDLTDGGQA
ncbi:MAG: DUF1588 domain-containing protein [Planctomycetota bacterium]